MASKSPKWRWLDAVQSDDGPRSAVRHLCLCLSTHMDKDGENCFPGMRTIATEMGVYLGRVSEIVAEAKATGWLEVEERHKGRRGGTHFVYRPQIPDPESVRDSGTVPARKAFGGPEHYESPVSVPDSAVSVPDLPPKVFRSAEQSSSGSIPLGVSHGNLPSVLTNKDGVPNGWQPPAGWQDHRVLFDLMDEDARRAAHGLLDGDARFAITAPSDLDLLAPQKLLRLQHWIATTREAA